MNSCFPQNKRQKSTAAKQMVVFGTESGSIFVACQASDKNSNSWEDDQTIYGAILKAKKPDQSDKFKIRKLEFCPFTKVVEGFGSVMWIWEYQGHHDTSADLAYGLRAHYLCTEKSLTGGSADQRISGGWRSHGGAEARREQREESTTGPGGQLACPVLLPVMLERPWLPTGISTRAPVIHPVRVHK